MAPNQSEPKDAAGAHAEDHVSLAEIVATGGKVDVTRRNFLTSIGMAAAGVLAGCTEQEREAYFQRHFQELSSAELQARLKREQDQLSKRFGKDVHVTALPHKPGVTFGYALDLARCIGCRRCVYACVKENNQSRDPQIQWIRVLEIEKARGIDLEAANPYYDRPKVPDPDHFYMPVACQQCRDPPCTKVCPVKATWMEPDGIVVVDPDWCIGCRSCMSACPYGARHFNWGEPTLSKDEVNPEMHTLGNRPRPRGVVEKCTFCIQRVRKGRYPACVEICPVGARKFGNLMDPESEISRILKEKRVFVLKAELKTSPKFYYFYGI